MIDNWREHMDEVRSEPFCVVLQPIDIPNRVRITYNSIKGGKIIEIEELNSDEQAISSCVFKGKSAIGSGEYWMRSFKDSIKWMSPKSWVHNKEIYIDSYYKKVA